MRELKLVINTSNKDLSCRTLPRVRELKRYELCDSVLNAVCRTLPRVRELKRSNAYLPKGEPASHPSQGA